MRVRGAMFGLDARIALTIFGALSVISGASLYSAIQEAKVTQQLAQIKEIEKAIEQYILDTGSMIPLSTSLPGADLSIISLVQQPAGVSGWKGPYLSLTPKDDGTDYMFRDNYPGKVYALTHSATEEWSPDTIKNCSSTTSQACAVYILHISDVSYINQFKAKLDGTSTNFKTGNVRKVDAYDHVYFKTNIPFDKNLSPNP